MSNPETNHDPSDRLLEEAAAWFARMRGPNAETSRASFQSWLARGARERQAYNRAAEIFAMGKLLDRRQTPPSSPPRTQKVAYAMAGALALVFAVTAVWFVIHGTSGEHLYAGKDEGRPSAAMRLETRAGETRDIRLADRSLVTLAGESILKVRFDRSLRELSLERGSARFTVTHEARPFVVAAGGGSVIARGTIFEVALLAKRRVTVHLVEGVVEIHAPNAANRRLYRGESASFASSANSHGDGLRRSAPANAARDRVAVDGARKYDAVRLADLVALANRDSARPIRLADAAIGQRRVSGHFRVDDTKLFAERLAALLGLAADEHDPGEIVLRRK